MKTVKYDWLTISKDERFTTISYNISEALNQENPRNIFLNWHLFIELECDSLLIQYYCNNMTNRKRTIFWNFLKSKYIDYSGKIQFLRLAELNRDGKITSVISKELYTSLKAVGAIRNAFHHNLDYGDALSFLTDGDKFILIKKPKHKTLASYKDMHELVDDFKSEVITLYEKLHMISFEIDSKTTW